jgi:hypothetical protein
MDIDIPDKLVDANAKGAPPETRSIRARIQGKVTRLTVRKPTGKDVSRAVAAMPNAAPTAQAYAILACVLTIDDRPARFQEVNSFGLTLFNRLWTEIGKLDEEILDDDAEAAGNGALGPTDPIMAPEPLSRH